MPTLAEFLKSEHERIQATQPERDALLKEWREGVGQLFAQIKQWVKAADTLGLLEVHETQTYLGEERLGRYTIPMLIVRFHSETLNRDVNFVPTSRFTAARVRMDTTQPEHMTCGMVDMISDAVDSPRHIYRVKIDGRDEWYCEQVWWGGNPEIRHGRMLRYTKWDQNLFDQLLVKALQ